MLMTEHGGIGDRKPQPRRAATSSSAIGAAAATECERASPACCPDQAQFEH
jgi:hypothetical protein